MWFGWMATVNMTRAISRVFWKRFTPTGAEVVIGSRFVQAGGRHTSFARSAGILFFRLLLRPILGEA